MRLSYYLKQRIVHQIINVVMLLFLVLTLFPIGWMVYSSLKENTDILAGKVALSRAKNGVVVLAGDKKYVYLCTQDGGINKLGAKTLKPKAYTSARTMATDFVVDGKYVWVSSANHGLMRIDKDRLGKKKEFKLPLKDIDPSKIASTTLIEDGKYLWFSMRYRGFEGVLKFDKEKGVVTNLYDLKNMLSPVQILRILKNNRILWVSTNKGLLRVEAKTGKVLAAYPMETRLPGGATSMVLSGSKLVLGSSTGVFIFDPWKGRIVKHYSQREGLVSNQVESLLVFGNRVYIGSNIGLSVLDLNNNKVSNYQSLFHPIKDAAKAEAVDKEKLTSGAVSAIYRRGGKVLLGSTFARLSVMQISNGNIGNTAIGKAGHLIVAWRNYIDMWKSINFGLYLRNSFLICGISSFFAMILATFSAYAISRFNFPGNRAFSLTILATQMVPGIMFLIPIYIMYIKFYEFTGIPLKGTFFGMILLYSAFFVPFSIWILRGFFAAIPYELEEAARIDGCSPLQVFWHIVLPLAMPGIVATGIYIFLVAWDELIFAWILTSGDTMTIPVGIRLFVGNYQNRFDLMMAAATVATIPVMVLFFMLQKQIVRGLTAGAVKG